MKSSFTELLPEKAPMVDQAIEICLADVKPQTKQLLNQDLQKTDVEEMLKEADGIQNDPMVRGRYLLNAALAAVQQKKLPLAIQTPKKQKHLAAAPYFFTMSRQKMSVEVNKRQQRRSRPNF